MIGPLLLCTIVLVFGAAGMYFSIELARYWLKHRPQPPVPLPPSLYEVAAEVAEAISQMTPDERTALLNYVATGREAATGMRIQEDRSTGLPLPSSVQITQVVAGQQPTVAKPVTALPPTPGPIVWQMPFDRPGSALRTQYHETTEHCSVVSLAVPRCVDPYSGLPYIPG